MKDNKFIVQNKKDKGSVKEENARNFRRNSGIYHHVIKILRFFVYHCSFHEYCIIYRNIEYADLIFQKNKVFKYKVLRPTLRYWYADPIICTEGNETYVLMEVFDDFLRKGFIGVSTFKEGILTRPKAALKEPFHLSFPTVFEYQGNSYMIPETSTINQIRIYKKGKDIYEWDLIKVFDNIEECVDTIVYVEKSGPKGEKVFLFTSQTDKTNPHRTKQKVFLLNNLEELVDISFILGKAKARFDVRNAGGFIYMEQSFMRVAQESTYEEYGKNLVFNEVLAMNDKEYKEKSIKKRTVEHIQIRKMPIITRKKGIHTYSLSEKYEIMDLNLEKTSIKKMIRLIIRTWIGINRKRKL